MSGGVFDYKEIHIFNIAEELELMIQRINEPDEYGYTKNLSCETIDEFKKGLNCLKQAAIYAHRIDYLWAGDDGEGEFMMRLKEDLSKIG